MGANAAPHTDNHQFAPQGSFVPSSYYSNACLSQKIVNIFQPFIINFITIFMGFQATEFCGGNYRLQKLLTIIRRKIAGASIIANCGRYKAGIKKAGAL
ncbi:MAG: hypothetical protein COB93_07015 [Sneathiella sp.]|nr:MAG: hypothetical protein COB93_07015 [Sneathiella sp.]